MNIDASKRKFTKFFKNNWPIFGFILIILIFFWKVFLQGKVPLPGDFIVGVYYPWLDYKWGYTVGVPVKNPITTDVVSLIYPEQMLAVDLLKKGIWPLWNPYILAGTPLLANLQAAPFSPTNFVYFIFDRLTGWSIQIVLQHILAALFMYILLRHWKISNLGSILTGIAFSFSGFNLIFSQWNGHTLSAAFIPLIIYFTDRVLVDGKFIYMAGLSLCLTFQLFSGYPQVSFYTALAIVIYCLIKLFKEGFVVIKKYYKLVICGLLALGLSAVQLLPTIELWKYSQRNFEPNPYEWAFLPWSKTITILAPDYYGNHATYNYWGPQDYTSNTFYVGVVVFILAMFSLRLINKSKYILFLLTLALFSLIIAYPTPLSVFLWRNNIFGLQSASAHRASILFNFAATGLAGFGLDYLMKNKLTIKDKIVYPFIVFLILSGFTFYALKLKGVEMGGVFVTKVALRNLILPCFVLVSSTIAIILMTMKKFLYFGAISLLGFLVLELFYFGWKFTPFSERRLIFPDTPVLEFLKSQTGAFRVTGNAVVPMNMRSVYGLESLEGYETIHPLRVSQFLSALNSGVVGTRPVGRYGSVDNNTSHLMDLVNTKYYLTPLLDVKGKVSTDGSIPSKYSGERFKLVFDDKSVAVLESKSVLPRAFMVYDWEVMKEDEKILSPLLDSNYPFSKKIILEEEPLFERYTSNKEIYNDVKYRYISEQESEVGVRTDKPGILFVSDAWFPGWKAFVDGEEGNILRADFMFKAVVVPKGSHKVRFIYDPESFKIGLRVTLVSFIILCGILVHERRLSKIGRRTS